MKTYRGVVSFTPLPLYPRERAPATHFIGGWVDRYGEVKIFYPTGTRTPAPPGRPACSQSLYRLSYPGSPQTSTLEILIDKYLWNFFQKACHFLPYQHQNDGSAIQELVPKATFSETLDVAPNALTWKPDSIVLWQRERERYNNYLTCEDTVNERVALSWINC
jgi:hypothetical protein